MYWALACTEVMHFTAASASSGCSVKFPIARLIPPSGGALGRSRSTRGYRAQAMSSSTDWSIAPVSTPSLAAP